MRVHGLESIVQLDSGSILRCAVRRVLKNLSTDQRHVVVTGDRVRVETQGTDQGWIVRIETRQSELARTSRQRRHVIAANIDQLLIVSSAAEPSIKPNLIDRLLATAEQNNLPATIVINKCDLIRPAVLQPLIGSYAQLGYRVLSLSAAKGWGVEALAKSLVGHNTVVIGQSGNDLAQFNRTLMEVGDDNNRKLATLFGEGRTQSLYDARDAERIFAATNNAVNNGSQTAQRMGANQLLSGGSATSGAGAPTSVPEMVMAARKRFADAVNDAKYGRVNEDSARQLAGMSVAQGQERDAFIRALRGRANRTDPEGDIERTIKALRPGAVAGLLSDGQEKKRQQR